MSGFSELANYPEALERYRRFEAQGHAANKVGNFQTGYEAFDRMHSVAVEYEDYFAELGALNPAAKSAYRMHQFQKAEELLGQALSLSSYYGWQDEHGIAHSNMGRLEAFRAKAETLTMQDFANRLAVSAVIYFKTAERILEGDRHYYYRYANAQHGSIVSALAGDEELAKRLITDGASVAFRRDRQYEQGRRTFTVNPRGLAQLAVAASLLPQGANTPVLAKMARDHLIG